MIRFSKIYMMIRLVFFLACFVSACNNAAESIKIGSEPVGNDTAISVADTMESQTGNVASVTVDTADIKSTNSVTDDDAPNASLAYAFKTKMKKGDNQLVQVNVQLNRSLEQVENNLRSERDEEKAREIGSSDTSRVKSMPLKADKYLLVSIEKYDTAVFTIDSIYGNLKQALKFSSPNKWIWRVTAKKETPKSEIFIIVRSEDANGRLHEKDLGILPIEITVAEKYEKRNEPEVSFFVKYKWLFISAMALLLAGLAVATWLKKRRLKELNSRIHFSYAWKEDKDTIVDELYLSLNTAGFNVIRDKANLGYRGLISGFMKDIGKGNIIIIVISDKYLKSRFCMFELYEIYRNCGMNKEAFVKKVFPVREEDINLSDPEVVEQYASYWKAEELELETMVKDKGQVTTSEQFAQYDAVKRIRAELGNLLSFLADINSLDIHLLSANDFAELKKSLSSAIEKMND